MAAPRGEVAVHVEGLSKLRRELGKIEKAIPRELTREMREVGKPVAERAASLAPKRSGRLSRSLRAFGAGRSASVGISSRLPYGNVIHWGGTTGRGHRPGVAGSGSVKVKAHPFIEKAALATQEQTLERMADAIERLLGRNGFR